MTEINEILNASSKQINDWSNEIVKSNKLSKESQFSDLSNAIVDYFRELLPNYNIYGNDVYGKNVNFSVRKKEDKKKAKVSSKEKDDIDLSGYFSNFLEPLSEEEEKLAIKIKETFLTVVDILGKLHPINYTKKLKELGLIEYTKIPKSDSMLLAIWSKSIIDYFKLNTNTPILTLIKNVIQFFDMIFPGYDIYYQEYKDKIIFPLRIDKIGDDSLGWATEIMRIRLYLFATHQSILEKLNRKNDFPKDSEYFFNLALIYEEMGLKDQANKYGEYGISLPQRDTFGLSELITFYFDTKRFTDGLKYMKQLGNLYVKKGMKKPALQMWQMVSRFDRGLDVASNLIILYKELGMNKELEIVLDHISKNKHEYKGIEELLKKLNLQLK
ncbi:MAG: hypothetical protein FK731_13090 [Asgard group archaeon]|nr:hypothetical protein [Asgard group archaeon]